MTQIILVRHGQTAWNREERFRGHADVPLDETGLAQAKAVAERIRSQWKPDAIYAGPLSRTIETARPTSQLFNLTVQPYPGLIDVDCGAWQGLTPEEARQRWPAEFEAYLHSPLNFEFPGGEGLEAGRSRALQHVRDLCARHPGQTVLLVSHTALNRLILLSVLGLNSSGFWRIRQDTCAINVFEFDHDQFTLTLLNETSHLLQVEAKQAASAESRTI